MTTVELERIARSIIPPVGATMAIARVDEHLKHRAAFLIDGRIHGAPVGPAFDRPRDAIRLVQLINGEAPRPGQSDLARTPGGDPDRRDAAGQTEAPDLGQALALRLGAEEHAAAGKCAGCGGPLSLGRHGQRRLTCSEACRQRAAYRRAHGLTGPDTDGVTPNLTPSRPAAG